MFLFPSWGAVSAAEAVEKAYQMITRSVLTRQVIDIAGHPLVKAHGASGAYSVIADDSDHHRIRRGLMMYKSVALCMFGVPTIWVLAHGDKSGSYPGDEYGTDLMAFRYYRSREDQQFPFGFDDQEMFEFVKLVGDKNDSFRSSLMTVMADGRLWIREKRIYELIEPELDKVILSSEPRKAIRLFAKGEIVEIGEAHQYRRDFPGILARAIRTYLNEKSVRHTPAPVSTAQASPA